MGLDMYLRMNRYVSPMFGAGGGEPEQIAELAGLPLLQREAVEVSATAVYWRKANQIHRWFVENVQGGVDECQTTYVSRDQLQELIGVCEAVLEARANEPADKARDVAYELLPPGQGFFFGSDEIDSWYWQDLEQTIADVRRALEVVPDEADFEYQSSW